MFNFNTKGRPRVGSRGPLSVGSLALAPSTTRCAHCSRVMGNFAGGSSRGWNGENLCHPNASNRPDCYHLVTVYGHDTPCTSTTCFEDHADLMTYVKAYPKKRKRRKAA